MFSFIVVTQGTKLHSHMMMIRNTPGTRVGPGFHNRMLTVKSRKTPNIPSSYANILGGKKFSLGVSRSGSKAKEVERRKRERRVDVSNNNGKYLTPEPLQFSGNSAIHIPIFKIHMIYT